MRLCLDHDTIEGYFSLGSGCTSARRISVIETLQSLQARRNMYCLSYLRQAASVLRGQRDQEKRTVLGILNDQEEQEILEVLFEMIHEVDLRMRVIEWILALALTPAHTQAPVELRSRPSSVA